MAEYIGPLKTGIKHQRKTNNKFDRDTIISETVGDSGNVLGFKGRSKSETFAINCPEWMTKLLEGLPDWEEIMLINTSEPMHPNSQHTHVGWYLLDNVKSELGRPSVLPVVVDAYAISRNLNEIFEMGYVPITEIGTNYSFTVVQNIIDTDTDFNTGSFNHVFVEGAGKAAKIRLDTGIKSQQRWPTAVDDSETDGVGTTGWTNQGGICGAGVAQASFSTVGWSRWLRGKTFNFAIPTEAYITGVNYGFSHRGTGPSYYVDYRLRIAGNTQWRWSKRFYDSNWRAIYIGGNGYFCELNPALFTPANVNAGIEIQVAVSGYTGGKIAQVDWMTAIMYYQFRSGDYTTAALATSPTADQWDKILIDHIIPSGCTVRYDVLKASDNTVLIADATGPTIDISELEYVNLKLKVKMTSNGTFYPSVNSIETTTNTGVEE